MRSGLRLFSHITCPYADRVTIVLLEKGAVFTRELVDLNDKPAWLRDASPMGRIPLLMIASEQEEPIFLFESIPICEYIDESVRGVRLFPTDPLANAIAKGWVEVSSQLLSNLTAYLRGQTHAPDPEFLIGKVASLLGSSDYISGEDFSFTDVAFVPLLRRYALLKEVRGEDVLADFPNLARWSATLLSRSTVVAAEQENFRTRYLFAYLGVNEVADTAPRTSDRDRGADNVHL